MFPLLLLRASSASSSYRCLLWNNGGKGGRLISSSNLQQRHQHLLPSPSANTTTTSSSRSSSRASVTILGHLDTYLAVRFSSTSSGGNDDNKNNTESDAAAAAAAPSHTHNTDAEADATAKLFNADDDARQYFLSTDDETSTINSPSSSSSSASSAAQLPPSYIRDAVTGKWTNKTHAELSMKDKQLLNLDDESKSEEVMRRLEQRWKEAASSVVVGEGGGGAAAGDAVDDGLGSLNSEHERLAHRIQEMQLALGPIGRDPAYYSSSSSSTTTSATDNQQLPLTPREYQALKTYAQIEYNIDPRDFVKLVSNGNTSNSSSSSSGNNSNEDAGLDDLIPHNTISSGPDHTLLTQTNKQYFDPDLDLAYLNPRLHRRAYKGEGGYEDNVNDPLADILPSDLNPTRKVNRRHAQLIPKRLLHHNNLSLLRRYTTPGGKIMNRVQSRLGAKDQRKIAKLVKRARHLGLIPHLGQWKLEDHGYLYERGVADVVSKKSKEEGGDNETTKKEWEVELEQRGLWPLQDDTEIIKKYYDLEAVLDHLGGPKGSEKRETLDRLLGGPGALV
jgi:ribosomal protein S18